MIDADLVRFIEEIPKAELHIHLDSASPDLLLSAARRNRLELPFETVDEARRWLVFEDLEDYLQKWLVTTSVLMTADDYHDIAYQLGRDMRSQNVVRCEAMFTYAAAHQDRVELDVLLEGLALGRADAKTDFGVDVCFIASLDRSAPPSESIRLVERIAPVMDDVGIRGIGFDCQEVGFPAGPHSEAFRLARAHGFRLSGHGGEEYAAGPEAVWDIIDTIRPDRVDHGNQAIRDDELIDHLVETQLPLTLCPLCNVAIQVYDDIADHPAIALRDRGVFVTINTDDQHFVGANLVDNYTQLAAAFDLAESDIADLARNSFRAAYCDEHERSDYLAALDTFLAAEETRERLPARRTDVMSATEWEDAEASRFRPDGVVGTPLHTRTARASATPWYFNWDLNHVVDVYDDFPSELGAIRETVAMGDMSPLCKCAIEGPDAGHLVDRLIPRPTDQFEVGQIYYTPWCTEEGKVVSDGLVYRVGEHAYRFTGDPTCEWFREKAEGHDVEIRDETDDFGIIMVQGPRSRAVVEAATGEDWSGLDFSRRTSADIAGVEVELARQGFTGELGYEIMMPAGAGAEVWDAIAAAGEESGIRPCGEWAIDVARVEAGLMIPGPDYANAGPDPTGSHTVSASDPECHSSPFELGMGRFVDLEKEDFSGRQALVAEQEAGGPPRSLVGLDIDWRAIVDAHLEQGVAPNVSPRVEWVAKPVTADGERIGRASSVTWSPTVRKLIGFGHVDKSHAREGSELAVRWEIPGTGDVLAAPARVARLPFLELRRT